MQTVFSSKSYTYAYIYSVQKIPGPVPQPSIEKMSFKTSCLFNILGYIALISHWNYSFHIILPENSCEKIT